MISRLFLTGILLCFTLHGLGQNGLPSTLGAKSIAMGHVGVTFDDIQAILNNQAGLASVSSVSFMIAAEQRFAISELQAVAAGVAVPTKGGVWGFSLQYFGFDLYNEQRIGLIYARSLLENFSIGAQFLFHNTRIEEYGTNWSPGIEIGFRYDITANLSVGAHVFNPARMEVADGEFLPTVFRLGFSYQSSEKALFAAEVSKDIDYPVQVRAGVEYRLVKPLFLRVGIQTAPEKWSFGVGYWMEDQQLVFDLSVSRHPFLGFTPAFGMTYPSR